MRYISHRGNVIGPELSSENSVAHVTTALNIGLEVEIDVWKTFAHEHGAGSIFLGHDGPDHKVSLDFLHHYKDRLWCHAKNFTALEFLIKNNFNCFWHDQDDYTITSHGQIIHHERLTNLSMSLYKNSVVIFSEAHIALAESMSIETKVYGVCSDYIHQLRSDPELYSSDLTCVVGKSNDRR